MVSNESQKQFLNNINTNVNFIDNIDPLLTEKLLTVHKVVLTRAINEIQRSIASFSTSASNGLSTILILTGDVYNNTGLAAKFNTVKTEYTAVNMIDAIAKIRAAMLTVDFSFKRVNGEILSGGYRFGFTGVVEEIGVPPAEQPLWYGESLALTNDVLDITTEDNLSLAPAAWTALEQEILVATEDILHGAVEGPVADPDDESSGSGDISYGLENM